MNGLCLNSDARGKRSFLTGHLQPVPCRGLSPVTMPQCQADCVIRLCLGQNQLCWHPLQKCTASAAYSQQQLQMPRCHRHVANPSWNVYFLNIEAKMGLETGKCRFCVDPHKGIYTLENIKYHCYWELCIFDAEVQLMVTSAVNVF